MSIRPKKDNDYQKKYLSKVTIPAIREYLSKMIIRPKTQWITINQLLHVSLFSFYIIVNDCIELIKKRNMFSFEYKRLYPFNENKFTYVDVAYQSFSFSINGFNYNFCRSKTCSFWIGNYFEFIHYFLKTLLDSL